MTLAVSPTVTDNPRSSVSQPLLEIENLHVTFSTRSGLVNAVKGVNFALKRGETLGIVGESGSGKSVTAFAVTGLLDKSGRIENGRILFGGEDITAVSAKKMQQLHGAAISMIFQNPRSALNPIRTVGLQIADAITAHERLTPAEARARALDLLKAVLIRDPEQRLDAYPHELSGGMCQRVMIAMAIACRPRLLIADEPTTGLDVTTQKTVMDLIAKITAERSMAMILITHDLGLAARYCDRIVVMEQGRIVEQAPPKPLFGAPQHPYTKRLVAASPRATSTLRDLVVDAGDLPHDFGSKTVVSSPDLLDVRMLVKRYDRGAPAVDGVSFRLGQGQSLGLVGESGSGKTTISRMVCRLLDQSDGDIIFDGQVISQESAKTFHLSPLRKDIQIVFQDPTDSLNPRYTAFDCIAHPLRRLMGMRDGKELMERVYSCAERTGLPAGLLDRFPHQLSGGQKARVGVARAIACRPRLLVLDEPTAALDVSVQATVLQLLEKLRREDNLAFLFVSHDLNVVRMMCDRTIVLQQGRIVEEGDSDQVFYHPQADYTRRLVDAIPHLENHSEAVLEAE